MRGKLLGAAVALLLVCSLVGCDNSTAARYNTARIDDTTRFVIERNGVHDGASVREREEQSEIVKGTPNWNELFDNVNNNVVNHNAAYGADERS